MEPAALTSRSRILIVDDEAEHLEFLQEVLAESYDVICAGDGNEAIRLARCFLPAVILLDVRMPSRDGLSACEELRDDEVTRHIPIIILSGSDETEQRVKAFEFGADDFVEKPYNLRELQARISSKVRRLREATGETQEAPSCGQLSLDSKTLSAWVDGRLVPLSVLEFRLLRFFVNRPNRILSRQAILKAVWYDCVVSERTVDAHIAAVRKKLGSFDHELATVYGAGYILRSSSSG